jgi:cell division GTPase FtsZ
MTGRYFNKGVVALDVQDIGHVMRETDDKLIIFGEGKNRYDIPKSEIQFAHKQQEKEAGGGNNNIFAIQ